MKNMKKLLSLLTVLFLLFAMTGIHSIALGYDTPQATYAEDYIIVQFDRTLPEVAINNQMLHYNLTREEKLNNTGLERIKINDNRSVQSLLAQLNNQPGIQFAEPDYILTPTATPEDDTYYSLLWGLNNVGQSVNGTSGDGSTDIDAPEAWQLTEGQSQVIVAVIDTAVDASHPDLQNVVYLSKQFNRGAAVYDHGTHVAGTIAANDNAIGVIGIAPNIKIMSLSFLGQNGGYTSDAIKAINFARDNGAHIINASWGGGGYSTALKDAIESFGGPFVAAAGNDGSNTDGSPHYPSAYDSPNIVSVAAVDNRGGLASFSNFGYNTVDVGAPGVNIASTYPGGYAYMSGTSMATPHVVGVLALMKSYQFSVDTPTLIQTLLDSGKPLAALNGVTQTGKIVNAYNALLALSTPPTDTTPPLLLNTTPPNNTQNVSLTPSVAVTFDEAIGVYAPNTITINGTPTTFSISGTTVNIDLPFALNYSSAYTVEVPASTFADLASNPYTSAISFTFETMAEPAPVTTFNIVSSSPFEGETNVSRSASITLSTDAAFNAVDVSKIILLDSKNNAISITVIQNNATTLTLDPAGKLGRNANYTLQVGEGALTGDGTASTSFTLHFRTASK